MFGLPSLRHSSGGRKGVDFSTLTPGPVTLPSWLQFTCFANRTCQVSANAVYPSTITPNQACVYNDGTIKGLMLEETRTNFALNGLASGFSSTNNGNGTLTTGRTDPASGTNAWRYQTSAGGFGNNQTIVPAAAHVLSAWMKTNSTNSYATLLENTVKDAGITVADTGGAWKRYSYVGSVVPAGVTVIGDCRSAYNSYSGSADADYSFVQTENGSYPTSYIVTTSTAASRAATVLVGVLQSTSSFNISMKNVKVADLQSCTDHPYVLANYTGDQTFSVYTNKTFTCMTINVNGETKNTDYLYNWVKGDVFESNITGFNTSTGCTITAKVIKNGVVIGVESINFSSKLNFASGKIVIGSDYLGAHSLSGYIHSIKGTFGASDLPEGTTLYDFSVGTRGAITLPSKFTFTCASTRTAQTSASTLVTGIGANVPALNVDGIQHEVESRNYVGTSRGAAQVNSSKSNLTVTTSVVAADGTTNACTISTDTTNSSYGIYAGLGAIAAAADCTVSIWYKSSSNFQLSAHNSTRTVQKGIELTGNNTWKKAEMLFPGRYGCYVANSIGTGSTATLTLTTTYQSSGLNVVNGDVIQVENEQMTVTSGGGTSTLTVSRSNPVAHSAYSYMIDITQGLQAVYSDGSGQICVDNRSSIEQVDNIGPYNKSVTSSIDFYQFEALPYSTSHIITTGTVATRAASTIILSGITRYFDMSFTAACARTIYDAGGDKFVLKSTTDVSFIRIDSIGRFHINDTITNNYTINKIDWNQGDRVRFVFSVPTSGSTNIKVYVNSVLQLNETIQTQFSTTSSTFRIGNNDDFLHFLQLQGISRLVTK